MKPQKTKPLTAKQFTQKMKEYLEIEKDFINQLENKDVFLEIVKEFKKHETDYYHFYGYHQSLFYDILNFSNKENITGFLDIARATYILSDNNYEQKFEEEYKQPYRKFLEKFSEYVDKEFLKDIFNLKQDDEQTFKDIFKNSCELIENEYQNYSEIYIYKLKNQDKHFKIVITEILKEKEYSFNEVFPETKLITVFNDTNYLKNNKNRKTTNLEELITQEMEKHPKNLNLNKRKI